MNSSSNTPSNKQVLSVVGGGLAGCEAAWQAAQRGAQVRLFEMRPRRGTAVHQTGNLAELVCSNSLKSLLLTKASGLLKEEMRGLDSLIISAAEKAAVPAGSALAVDREKFAEAVTSRLAAHPRIEIVREEITEIPGWPCIVASGPLTSPELAASIQATLGDDFLKFFDAVAPIIDADSLDYDRMFHASRYDKGDAAYWNSPLNDEQYDALREALMSAERSESHNPDENNESEGEGDDTPFFESCLPIEELANRGRLTMRYGPLRGAGLTDPKTGRWPFACAQLRPENLEGTMYNLVGFQTRLKWPEQTRVLRLLPGLENVEIVRFGVIHKNIFINSPAVLRDTLQTQKREDLFFAGQLTGVEGYVESAAAGLLAGLNAARLLSGQSTLCPPRETALGSLMHYITAADAKHFQPMNINWALLPPLAASSEFGVSSSEFQGKTKKKKLSKDEKAEQFVARARGAMSTFIEENQLGKTG